MYTLQEDSDAQNYAMTKAEERYFVGEEAQGDSIANSGNSAESDSESQTLSCASDDDNGSSGSSGSSSSDSTSSRQKILNFLTPKSKCEDTPEDAGGGAHSASSKRSMRRYFQEEDSSVI